MGSASAGDTIRSISNWNLGVKATTTSRSKASDEFGSLTFNDEAQRARLPKDVYRALRRAVAQGEPIDAVGRRHHRRRAEGLGGRARRHALHALVPADDRHHRREARLVSLADGRRPRRRRVQRQGADQGRARRLEFPVRRHALNLRGARLHGVGSDQPALAAGDAERHDARHPDGVRQLDRRSPRQEDAAPALDGGPLEAGRPHPEALRLQGPARRRDLRSRAGILPDRSPVLLQSSGPHQRRPDALRRQASRRARSSRISISARSPTACSRS